MNLERLTKNFMISISQIAYVEQSDIIAKACRKYLDFYRYATESGNSSNLYFELKAFNDLTLALNNPFSRVNIPIIDIDTSYQSISVAKFKIISFINKIVDLNFSTTTDFKSIEIVVSPTSSVISVNLYIDDKILNYTEEL